MLALPRIAPRSRRSAGLLAAVFIGVIAGSCGPGEPPPGTGRDGGPPVTGWRCWPGRWQWRRWRDRRGAQVAPLEPLWERRRWRWHRREQRVRRNRGPVERRGCRIDRRGRRGRTGLAVLRRRDPRHGARGVRRRIWNGRGRMHEPMPRAQLLRRPPRPRRLGSEARLADVGVRATSRGGGGVDDRSRVRRRVRIDARPEGHILRPPGASPRRAGASRIGCEPSRASGSCGRSAASGQVRPRLERPCGGVARRGSSDHRTNRRARRGGRRQPDAPGRSRTPMCSGPVRSLSSPGRTRFGSRRDASMRA